MNSESSIFLILESFAYLSSAQNFFLDITLFYIALVIALGAYAWSPNFIAAIDSRISDERKMYVALKELLKKGFDDKSLTEKASVDIQYIDDSVLKGLKLGNL